MNTQTPDQKPPQTREWLRLPWLIDGTWLDGVVICLGIFAAFSTGVVMLRAIEDLDESTRWLLACGFLALCWALLLRFSNVLISQLKIIAGRVGRVPLWVYFAVGITLRLAWSLVFPAQPGSDGAVYLSLASKLLEQSEYSIAGTHAYWPPGYPFLLAFWQVVLPGEGFHYVALNLLLFASAFWGTAWLARHLAGDAAGRYAGLMIAAWPNLIASAATPEKELVVIALLPWVTLLLAQTVSAHPVETRRCFAAGVLLGACTLVQPSLQFLILGAALLFVLGTGRLSLKLRRVVLVLLGSALVIFPWTYRNYQIFDQMVLVSSNGGGNLYRANNPLATGGYTKQGAVDLSGLSELEQDREGKRLALDWMRNSPIDFVQLMFEKQIRFMGDDATGIYSTLKVGKASDNSLLYTALKMLANSWWIGAWGLLAFMASQTMRKGLRLPVLSRLPVWLWLYLFVLHSVFESAGKYHMPTLWVLPVMLSVYLNAIAPHRRVK